MNNFKKYRWYILAFIALSAILIALVAKWGVINKGIIGSQNQITKEETVIPIKTATFKDKVIEHEAKLISLQNTIDNLSSRLDALESACNSKTNSSSYKKVVTTNQGKTNKLPSTGDKSPQEEIINIRPIPDEIKNVIPIPRDGQPNTANLDYLRQNGKILFCITVNGLTDHYFPQFAIERGVSYTSVKINQTKNGTNWEVEPVDGYKGDVGVTNSGILFVKASPIETVMKANAQKVETIEILTSYTDWKPTAMVSLGEYWVLETR